MPPLPSRVSLRPWPKSRSAPEPPVATSFPSPPNRLARGSAPLASSSVIVSLPPRPKTWISVVLATVGVPPFTVIAPPLTRIAPAAFRLMVMVLFALSPLTVRMPDVKVATVAALAGAAVATMAPPLMAAVASAAPTLRRQTLPCCRSMVRISVSMSVTPVSAAGITAIRRRSRNGSRLFSADLGGVSVDLGGRQVRRTDVGIEPLVESGRAAPGFRDPALGLPGRQPVRGTEVPAGGQTLVLQEANAGMIPRVAARRGRQRPAADRVLALEGGDACHQVFAGRLAVDGRAEPAQLVGRHLVVAARGVETVRIDLDVVELPALALGDGPLAGLVRTLVGAEPHVPVGAEDLERTELGGQLGGQREHRATHGRLVDVAVSVPEVPRVVHGELLVELDRGGREPFERGNGRILGHLLTVRRRPGLGQ